MPVPFPRDIAAVLVSHMDFPTLMEYRQASKESLRLVREELTTSLFYLVARFVPNPAALLAKLDQHGAFISGSTALQFFLRDVDVKPRDIDIFLPYGSLPPLLLHLLAQQDGIVVAPTDPIIPTLVHVLAGQAVTFRTPFGTVTLWESDAGTPFLPIVRGATSAHFVYVNPTYFGCAYPELLFQHRAIVGRPDEIGFDRAIENCKQRGIDVRLSTKFWSDLASRGRCAAQYHACPSQGRTFSDLGSLKGRMRPLVDEEVEPGVAWRLDYRPCGRGCALPTPLLPIPNLLQNIL